MGCSYKLVYRCLLRILNASNKMSPSQVKPKITSPWNHPRSYKKISHEGCQMQRLQPPRRRRDAGKAHNGHGNSHGVNILNSGPLYIYIYVCVYMCICVYVYMCICVYVYMCICVCVYVCMCLCVIGGQSYLLLAMDMAKVGGRLSVVKVSHKFEPPKSTSLLLNSDFCWFCRLLIYNCLYIYIRFTALLQLFWYHGFLMLKWSLWVSNLWLPCKNHKNIWWSQERWFHSNHKTEGQAEATPGTGWSRN